MRNMVVAAVCWLAGLGAVCSPLPAQEPAGGRNLTVERVRGTRWALLIGVDDYLRARRLDYCGADMKSLAARLTEVGFPQNHVYLMHDRAEETRYRPAKNNIEQQLDLVLGLADAEDLVLLAFSGHGVNQAGKSFLCPPEARLQDPKTLIELEAIYERMAKCRARTKLILVDACRNEVRLAGERSLDDHQSRKSFDESLEKPPAGILMLTSCAAGQISREEREFGHGVFTHYLLAGLEGGADVNGDGQVSLMELYLFTKNETKAYVARKFADLQTPALRGDIVDFDFARASAREISNSIGMKLVLVPAGEFMMGSAESAEDTAGYFHRAYALDLKADSFKDEHPAHRVRITRPFYLGAYEVTRGQFRQFVSDSDYKTDAEKDGKGGYGFNASESKWEQKPEYTWRNAGFEQADSHPVVNVSWNDAVAFCEWLSRREGKTYRLPTEAEWEYACRAGTTTRYSCGDDAEGLAQVGNVADAAAKATFPDWKWTIAARDGYVFTAPVGTFRPNRFGLYDMHGNAWEWCADWYGSEYYAASPANDPTGPDSRDARVLRGGSWDFGPDLVRSAFRYWFAPGSRLDSSGFRPARTN